MSRLAFSFLIFVLFALRPHSVSGQSLQQKELLRKSYDAARLNRLGKDLRKQAVLMKNEFAEKAKENGWPMRRRLSNGTYQELRRIAAEGYLVYYSAHNDGAAATVRTTELYESGSLGLNLHGSGMVVGVWEGGAPRHAHQLFEGRAVQKDGVDFNGHSSEASHATHVTGTLIGSGTLLDGRAQGMADKAEAWVYNWDFDVAEAADAAAVGLLVSNHSYGYAAFDGEGN
ncbi:MAG: hypothetical protein MI784_16380, partial [Cytophagales bacterium]|nr:hypothetical protein [Cytophagales bacterium]